MKAGSVVVSAAYILLCETDRAQPQQAAGHRCQPRSYDAFLLKHITNWSYNASVTVLLSV